MFQPTSYAEVSRQLTAEALGVVPLLVAAGSSVAIENGTVTHTAGRCSSLLFILPNIGTVDCSMDVVGKPDVATLTLTRPPSHDDERDEDIVSTVIFPRTEQDIQTFKGFLSALSDSVRL